MVPSDKGLFIIGRSKADQQKVFILGDTLFQDMKALNESDIEESDSTVSSLKSKVLLMTSSQSPVYLMMNNQIDTSAVLKHSSDGL